MFTQFTGLNDFHFRLLSRKVGQNTDNRHKNRENRVGNHNHIPTNRERVGRCESGRKGSIENTPAAPPFSGHNKNHRKNQCDNGQNCSQAVHICRLCTGVAGK